jgi:beta-glucosidase-like glycosyl hydrolase
VRRAAALLIAVALPLAACSGEAPTSAAPSTPSPEPSPSPSTSPSPSPSSTAPRSPEQQVEATLTAMSREEQIAQLFVVGVRLDDIHQGDDLADEGVGGIFLAGRSQLATDGLAEVTAAWQETAGATGLWVAVDQEGGNVQTLSGPGFAELPTAQEQGRLPESQLQELAGDMGASLSDAGINLDLAPVVDVVPAGTEQQNAPIGAYGRQYGATAAEVAAAAGVVVDGLHEHGVTATLKHFPGLGRVRDNTDTSGRVVDTVTRPDDPQVRLFGKLARSLAAPFVMTSSAVYRTIDDTQPAGWSEKVIDQLLRGELGFDGVVISDDVGAAAAVQDVPPGERAIRCLDAGGTLVLTVDRTLFPEMLAAVVDRDRTDDAFSRTIDAAVRTALLAKADAGLLAR